MNARPSRPLETAPTDRIGRHELLLRIASGGMATVYLARMHGPHGFTRAVALKLLHAHLREAESNDWAAALIEEAKLASQIHHPNVVPVVDVGEDPAGIFLVMDYIEGDSLHALLVDSASSGALPRAVAIRILIDALAGLHAAHELRDASGRSLEVVHRDVSPHNVLVGVDGIARLTDFGIAKSANRLDATRTGLLKGKIGYMSPEQARAQTVDRRCDVWAAGVVAWELLARRRLFPNDGDPVARLLRLCTEDAPRLSDLCDVPPGLDEAVAWALTRDARSRCPTADDLRRAILEGLGRHGEAADACDVAAHVTRIAGPKLAARRAHVERVLARCRAAVRGDADPGRADALAAPASTVSNPTDPITTSTEVGPNQTGIERARSAAAVGRRSSRKVVGGVAAAALLFGAIGLARWRGSKGALEAGVEGAEPTPGAGAPSASSDPSTAPRPSGEGAPSAGNDPAPSDPLARAMVRISANAPIVEVIVASHAILVPDPSADLTVQLTPDEARGAVPVKARSADGRMAQAEIDPGAQAVALVFPASRVTPSRGHARTSPAKSTPPDRAIGAAGVPLASDPYKKTP